VIFAHTGGVVYGRRSLGDTELQLGGLSPSFNTTRHRNGMCWHFSRQRSQCLGRQIGYNNGAGECIWHLTVRGDYHDPRMFMAQSLDGALQTK